MKNILSIEEIKSKIGIIDFSKITNEQFNKIQEMASRNEINKNQMELLVKLIPNFIQLQQTYVDTLKSIISSARDTQKEALLGISATLDRITSLLEVIINKSETEELRVKIADIALKLADYGLEIAKIVQDTNKDNNTTWKYIAGGASAVVALVGLFVVANR